MKNELRIGNLILFEDEVIKVATIGKMAIGWGKSNFAATFLDSFKPIPLSGEWLVKFGFKKTIGKLETIYRLGLFEYATSCKTIDIEFPSVDHDVTYTTNIKYIHQLQNLYFALTGTELKIK